MVRRTPAVASLLAVALSVTTVRTAAAQPASPPLSPPSAPLTPPAEAGPAAATAAPVVTAAAASDPAEVRAAYDRAFAALVARDWATAVALFDRVAADSIEADRRGAARELARYARTATSSELAAHRSIEAEDRSSGRAGFVVSTTLASFYTGFVLDDLLAIGSYKGSVGIVTAATATGLVASVLGSRALRMSEGVASAYSTGLLLGLGNGLLLAPPLGIDVEPSCGSDSCSDGAISQAYLGVGLATMVAGGALGTALGARYEPTAPQARLVSLLAFNGLITAGLVGVMVAAGDSDADANQVLLVLGAGLDLGLGAGLAIAPGVDWSDARMTYVALGEAVGALGGVAAVTIALDGGGDSARASAGILLASTWAGFGGAAYLTRGMTPHRRYAAPAPSTAITVAPMTTSDGGRGVSLAGQF